MRQTIVCNTNEVSLTVSLTVDCSVTHVIVNVNRITSILLPWH